MNLEFLSDLETIKEDPARFINSIKEGVIIDEVQRFPDILSYIQVSIDNEYKAGKFIITGSQNLLLSEKITQSLAKRVEQLVNLSEIGNLIGVNHKTINDWLSILEASYIVFKLEPYFNTLSKNDNEFLIYTGERETTVNNIEVINYKNTKRINI